MRNKIHPRLRDIIDNKGWKSFTDIQLESFDPIFSGDNCIIEAPTSGGKTEAVFFPLLTKISADKNPGVKILYIAPLKALLNDIQIRADEYTQACYLNAFKWHGDVSQAAKMQQMILPAEVLLTTPESLEAIFLRKANWNEWFKNLQSVVIDEAHNFALTERGSHLISLLERLDHEITARPQRIAVTATIGNPDELLKWLLGATRKEGKKIVVKNKKQKEKDFKVHFFDEESEDTSNRLNIKFYSLLPKKKSIVFRNSRSGTEDSAKYINERNKQLKTNFPVQVRTHHSSVSKYFRENAEFLIKVKNEKSLNAIISTSTLELGIDIGELDQVIQIGELTSASSFMQRVGRTGRRPDKPQYFRGLCENDEDLLLLTACINLGLRGIPENIIFPKKAYHILAHQVICLCLQKLGIHSDKIWQILSNAYCFSHISRDKFDSLIKYMIKEDYLRKVDNDLLITSNKTEEIFLKANWKRLFAIFDSGPMYDVVDGKKVIGTLDSSFARMQKLPFLFVLGGIEWKALKINHEAQQISVQKTRSGNIPKWKVFRNSDIPHEVAREMGKILMDSTDLDFLDEESKKGIEKLREQYRNLKWEQPKWVFDHAEAGKLLLWTFAGDKINRTVSILINALEIAKTDYDSKCIEIESSDESVDDFIPQIISFIKALKGKTAGEIEDILIKEIRNIKFSKFSLCLPEALSKEALIEKSFDVEGLLRELDKVTIQPS